MNATRSAAILLGGAGVGFLLGWTAQSPSPPVHVSAPPPREQPRSSPAPVAVADTALLAQEHEARLAAEKERDALKAELATVRSASAPFATYMRRAARMAAPVEKLPPYAPDVAAKRLATIANELESVLKQKEVSKRVELLRDLARIGRSAWPQIEQLLTAPPPETDDDNPDIGYAELSMAAIQLFQGELRDLAMDALLDPQAHSTDFRRLVTSEARGLAGTADEVPRILAALGRETDPDAATAMIYALRGERGGGEMDLAGIGQALRVQPSAQVRAMIVDTLQGEPGTDQLLADAARSDPDPSVQRKARVALVAQSPPRQGYLVTGLVPESQAVQAGIQEGDLIVSYNGNDVRSYNQLARLKSQVAPGASVQVGVFRDNSVVYMTLKPGQIGVTGQVVKPK